MGGDAEGHEREDAEGEEDGDVGREQKRLVCHLTKA
jgi:hypothetical protein